MIANIIWVTRWPCHVTYSFPGRLYINLDLRLAAALLAPHSRHAAPFSLENQCESAKLSYIVSVKPKRHGSHNIRTVAGPMMSSPYNIEPYVHVQCGPSIRNVDCTRVCCFCCLTGFQNQFKYCLMAEKQLRF